ncbi:MAG: helix-turn-helix domain-containing protein [Clostridiales bacterium]|jgi:transcriptional regulator with XRE-family HTH domain|nr:helix-turn-helix domain-containing protein [Clostridiales bacterium]
MENRIKALREDKDLRQIDVADKTGIDQKTLSNYETGKTNPDSYALIKLADFFNVTVDYLLCRSTVNLYSNQKCVDELTDIQKKLEYIKLFFKI